jgi:hypothetical protein
MLWKIDPKDKRIHKNKYDTHLHVEHVCNNGTSLWHSGRGEGIENDSQYQNISLQVEGIMIWLESC